MIAEHSVGRNSVVGTPYWMSPEVIGDQPYGTSADVWSAGVVLRELLQRRPPYFDLPVFRAMYLIRTQVISFSEIVRQLECNVSNKVLRNFLVGQA